MMTVNAITMLRDRLTVEVRLGEMADVLERTRYKALDGSKEAASTDGSVSAEDPDKYSVVHMSNIP